MKKMVYCKSFEERVVLDSGEIDGYHYWIISYGTHPCAYVEIPKGHPYYGISSEDAYDLSIDCHCGITYGDFGLGYNGDCISQDKFLLGWDYNHFCDYNAAIPNIDGKKWKTEEILWNVWDVIKQLKEVQDEKSA